MLMPLNSGALPGKIGREKKRMVGLQNLPREPCQNQPGRKETAQNCNNCPKECFCTSMPQIMQIWAYFCVIRSFPSGVARVHCYSLIMRIARCTVSASMPGASSIIFLRSVSSSMRFAKKIIVLGILVFMVRN